MFDISRQERTLEVYSEALQQAPDLAGFFAEDVTANLQRHSPVLATDAACSAVLLKQAPEVALTYGFVARTIDDPDVWATIWREVARKVTPEWQALPIVLSAIALRECGHTELAAEIAHAVTQEYFPRPEVVPGACLWQWLGTTAARYAAGTLSIHEFRDTLSTRPQGSTAQAEV